MNTKTRILELLESHRGDHISGEHMAEELHISRNAVWKAVKELRKEGYTIAAVTNKGYRLLDGGDRISAQGIRLFLSQDSRPYAENIHVYSSLESTNKTAKDMAMEGAGHGTVVISDCQTSGRGRYSRPFFSPAGGLYLSMILRPDVLHLDEAAAVTAWAAVSVCEAIEAVSENTPRIKWVNDIFIDDKKVGGILTEAVSDFESGHVSWIVLGIGVNVHARPEDFPPGLQASAASICPDKKRRGVRNQLAAELINRLLGRHTPPDKASIFDTYRKRLMMLGRDITVIQGKTAYRATAVDVDAAGHLLVKNENGEMISLSSGEILSVL